MTPLLVFDTNVVMDIWLGRDGEVAVLLLQLAEQGRIDLVIPEFVLMEFQGTARRWVTDQRALLADSVRRLAKEWGRSSKLGSDPSATPGGRSECCMVQSPEGRSHELRSSLKQGRFSVRHGAR